MRDAGRVDPRWPKRELPCKRMQPASTADHLELRDATLIDDGLDASRWRVQE
jgi:hypothetical protein